jgi:hypothetical protein
MDEPSLRLVDGVEGIHAEESLDVLVAGVTHRSTPPPQRTQVRFSAA